MPDRPDPEHADRPPPAPDPTKPGPADARRAEARSAKAEPADAGTASAERAQTGAAEAEAPGAGRSGAKPAEAEHAEAKPAEGERAEGERLEAAAEAEGVECAEAGAANGGAAGAAPVGAGAGAAEGEPGAGGSAELGRARRERVAREPEKPEQAGPEQAERGSAGAGSAASGRVTAGRAGAEGELVEDERMVCKGSGAVPGRAESAVAGGSAALGGVRVALVLGTSAGGVGRHVRSVAAGLVARGARVLVCGPADTEELFGFTGAGARFAEVDLADRPRPLRDARALARLRALLRGADVVHAHGLRAGALAAAALAGVAPGPLRFARGGPPLVVTLHNAVLAGGATAAVYGALERVVARGATRVLGVSPDLEERMRDLGARSVGHALVPAPAPRARPGAAARADVRAELGLGDRPLILTVGRLAEQKGLPTLLDAAGDWASRTPVPLVAIAGDGPLAGRLRDRIEAEDLPVRLLGRRADVPALLAAADVAVVPSVWEGQPLIVQEVLRAGRPLVAARVGGIPALVGADGRDAPGPLHGPESEAALLVPPGDAEALARAVSRVLDDQALAARLGSAAARRAALLPGEDDAAEQLAALYLELRDASRR